MKHLLFYSGDVINVGVEVLPVKAMAKIQMAGVSYLPVLPILKAKSIISLDMDVAAPLSLY